MPLTRRPPPRRWSPPRRRLTPPTARSSADGPRRPTPGAARPTRTTCLSVPDEDDEDPGPWFPPHDGPDGFAPTPLVLDLVAPVDPEVNPDLDGGPTGLSGGTVQCDGQCIEWATVEVGGTSASFAMHTTVPARLWVSMDAPAVQNSVARVRDWVVTFEGLTPDTLYNVVLVAEDQHGNLNHRFGQFRTLKRHAEITFTSIHVVNDADKRAAQQGRGRVVLRGRRRLDRGLPPWRGQDQERPHRQPRRRPAHRDQRRRPLRRSSPCRASSTTLGSASPGLGPSPTTAAGTSAGCRDVATAVATIDLDDLIVDDPALPAGYDGAFMLRTREHYLQFDAYGTIDVWYE